jgi:hypothetical protein
MLDRTKTFAGMMRYVFGKQKRSMNTQWSTGPKKDFRKNSSEALLFLDRETGFENLGSLLAVT